MSHGSPVANHDLLRLLAKPDAAVGRPGRSFSSHKIRVCVAALDGMQVVLTGLLLQQLFPAVPQALWQTLCLALLVSVLAALTRRALRVGTAAHPDSLASVSLRAAAAVVVATMTVVACAWAVGPLEHDEAMAVLGWATSWASVSAVLAYSIRHGADGFAEWMGHAAPALAVIGPAEATRSLLAAVQFSRQKQPWRIAACVGGNGEDLDRLADLAQSGRLDVVAVVVRQQETLPQIAAVCARLADQPVRICLALDLLPNVEGLRPAAWLGGVPLFDLRGCPHQGWPGTIKRAADVLIGGAALAALSPVFAAVALAIRLETPGTPFFAQWRFGQGSRPIRVWKFRTMHVANGDATGGQRTLARDPRVTPIGRLLRRTSIDELPQLINVVRGEMSLVGPRPHPLHMRVGDAYYFDAVEGYRIRHCVKPGITGWAQINGSRGEIDTLAKARLRLQLDRWYLNNWSLALDVRIVLRTMLGGFATSAD